jgi:two-component system chemotaxis response regulator CheY
MTTPEALPRKLLVVDDEDSVLKLLKTLLTRANYRVNTCSTGSDALKLLSQSSYDLMITDAMMPKMTGVELVKTVRANPSLQQLPILMLTRKNDRNDVKTALQAGVTDYVIKPIDEQLLIDKVELSLKNRSAQNRLRDVAVHGADTHASANIDIRVISVRETGITARFPISLPLETPFRLETPIFKEIGIVPPLMKISVGENKDAGSDHQMFADYPFEMLLTFVGINESDLKKIRAWMTRQEIQRKK